MSNDIGCFYFTKNHSTYLKLCCLWSRIMDLIIKCVKEVLCCKLTDALASQSFGAQSRERQKAYCGEGALSLQFVLCYIISSSLGVSAA